MSDFKKISFLLSCNILLLCCLLGEEDIRPILKENSKIIKLVKNLKEGEGIYLPKFKVVGDFNKVAKEYLLHRDGPSPRDWCIKMVWMPDRNRAFYCGANHGSPHRLNDAWEYDLGANTWAMLYAPDGNKHSKGDWSDAIVKEGIPQTKRGGPVMIGHVWWALTYHEEDRKAYFLSYWPYEPKEWESKLWAGKKVRKLSTQNPPMWSFDCYKKKWLPMPTVKSPPNKGKIAASSVLEYFPESKSIYYKLLGSNYLYDTKNNSYKKLTSEGPLPSPDAVYVYDPKNKILVAHIGGYFYGPKTPTTWEYDLKKNSWSKIKIPSEVPNGHDGMATFVYDPIANVCLLHNMNYKKLPEDPHVWSYDVATKKWQKHQVNGVVPSKKMMGYFDRKHNVLVIHEGVYTKAKVWVYRHSTKVPPEVDVKKTDMLKIKK